MGEQSVELKGKSVLYLTWGEDVVDNGIFNAQVFDLLKLIRTYGDYTIDLLSGFPVGFKYIKSKKKYTVALESLRNDLSQSNVGFYTRKIYKISPHLHSEWWATPFYYFPHVLFLSRFIKNKKYDIIHCRSYHAACLALLVRSFSGEKYKIVFDTRGLLPEEGVFIGAYSKSSLSYKFWKAIEHWLLVNSDAVVNVSKTFSEQIDKTSNKLNSFTIYTSANTEIFKPTDSLKGEVRSLLGIARSSKVLVYSGSLGNSSWHDAAFLCRLFLMIKSKTPCLSLLLITRSDRDILKSCLSDYGIKNEDYNIVEAKTPWEVSYYLQCADYAALPFRQAKDDIDRLLGYTMVASKTGEYLACGLPVIVNEAIGGASRLIEEYHAGVTFDADDLAAVLSKVREIDLNYEYYRQGCLSAAKHQFDSLGNARKYLGIYNYLG